MEIVSEALHQIAKSFIYNGVIAILFGVLIFIYPNLLGMLVGIFLVVVGIVGIFVALKIFRYSKMKI
ncbi:MAG: DUF3096 domain-containing protein [Candidatus Paceibacterota bacterium]|jgi:uncharacterized membrane protein HdeD (DUF308 family)|nr:DUF3096 domain-containing protein [bacterium]